MSYGKWKNYVNVKDFGAKGDGNNDDTAPIQAALDYAQAENFGGALAGNVTASFNMPTIYLPRGHYSVNNLYMNSYIHMMGEGYAWLQARNYNNTRILQTGGAESIIQGINFIGGRRQIEIFGSETGANPVAGYRLQIRDCTFKSNSINTTALWMNTQYIKDNYAGRDSSAYTFAIDDCEIETVRAYNGSTDQCTFTNCRVTWPASYWTSALCAEEDFGCFNFGDHLHLKDCYLIGFNSTANRLAYIRTYLGNLYVENTRQGDMGAIFVRIKKPGTDYTRDENFGGVQEGEGAIIRLENSNVSGCAGLHWLEIYDRFPREIYVRGYKPLSEGISKGIYIDTSTTYSGVFRNIDIDDFGSTTDFWYGTQPYNAAINQDTDDIDLVNYKFAPWMQNEVFENKIHDYLPQQNLMTPGVYHDTQFLTQAFNFGLGTTEAETGYAMRSFVALTNSTVLAGAVSNWSPPDGKAGLYTFSLAYKINVDASVQINAFDDGLTIPNLARDVKLFKTDTFQRFYYRFHYDGITPKDLQFAIYNCEIGANVYIGLPMITRGDSPAPYLFPGTDNPRSHITQHSRLTAVPASGAWKLGDIVDNAVVAAGSPPGWLCTTAGSPGTFTPYGALGISAGLTTATSLNFGSIPAAGQEEQSITVTGATQGDAVAHTAPPLEPGLISTVFTSGSDKVIVRVSNITGSPINPAAGTWKVTVLK